MSLTKLTLLVGTLQDKAAALPSLTTAEAIELSQHLLSYSPDFTDAGPAWTAVTVLTDLRRQHPQCGLTDYQHLRWALHSVNEDLVANFPTVTPEQWQELLVASGYLEKLPLNSRELQSFFLMSLHRRLRNNLPWAETFSQCLLTLAQPNFLRFSTLVVITNFLYGGYRLRTPGPVEVDYAYEAYLLNQQLSQALLTKIWGNLSPEERVKFYDYYQELSRRWRQGVAENRHRVKLGWRPQGIMSTVEDGLRRRLGRLLWRERLRNLVERVIS